MNLTKNNLLDAVNELKSKGFNEDFILEKDILKSLKTHKTYAEEDFKITDSYRFDTDSTADTQYLYIIETTDGKGLLIDMYADLFSNLQGLISKKAGENMHNHQSADDSIRYGMEKIYKNRFEESPERYELRKGFPDFPACPFGNSFSMLGYDKKDEKYVWLVTSILKDDRLQEVDYQP